MRVVYGSAGAAIVIFAVALNAYPFMRGVICAMGGALFLVQMMASWEESDWYAKR